MNWVVSTLIAVSLFICGLLSLKKAGTLKSNGSIGWLGNIIFSLVLGALALSTVLVFSSQREQVYQLNRNTILWLILFGVFFFCGNAFFFKGITSSDNPGLARALMTLEVVGLTIGSWFLFNESINNVQILGILLVVLGAILVSL